MKDYLLFMYVCPSMMLWPRVAPIMIKKKKKSLNITVVVNVYKLYSTCKDIYLHAKKKSSCKWFHYFYKGTEMIKWVKIYNKI